MSVPGVGVGTENGERDGPSVGFPGWLPHWTKLWELRSETPLGQDMVPWLDCPSVSSLVIGLGYQLETSLDLPEVALLVFRDRHTPTVPLLRSGCLETSMLAGTTAGCPCCTRRCMDDTKQPAVYNSPMDRNVKRVQSKGREVFITSTRLMINGGTKRVSADGDASRQPTRRLEPRSLQPQPLVPQPFLPRCREPQRLVPRCLVPQCLEPRRLQPWPPFPRILLPQILIHG